MTKALRAVPKPAEAPPPFRHECEVPYFSPVMAQKWRSAVAWLRRDAKSRWILDTKAERES